MRPIALIVSPASGRGADGAALAGRLRDAGAEVELFDRERLDAAAVAGADRIVIASGDGSVGAAAEVAARAAVPLAVIPVGTANNFAAAQGLPTDQGEACRLAARGERTRSIELGRAGEIPFVNLASAGLAPVAADRAARWKRVLGPAAYTVGAASAAATTAPVECEITVAGTRRFSGEAWQVMVAVTGAFGAGVRVEGTDPGDGALDLVVYPAEPRRRLLRRGWWMRRGRVASQPGVVLARASELQVEVPAGTRFNVDGEVVELGGAARFTVEPAAFRLVVPGD